MSGSQDLALCSSVYARESCRSCSPCGMHAGTQIQVYITYPRHAAGEVQLAAVGSAPPMIEPTPLRLAVLPSIVVRTAFPGSFLSGGLRSRCKKVLVQTQPGVEGAGPASLCQLCSSLGTYCEGDGLPWAPQHLLWQPPDPGGDIFKSTRLF